jgi:hypothetical protein
MFFNAVGVKFRAYPGAMILLKLRPEDVLDDFPSGEMSIYSSCVVEIAKARRRWYRGSRGAVPNQMGRRPQFVMRRVDQFGSKRTSSSWCGCGYRDRHLERADHAPVRQMAR